MNRYKCRSCGNIVMNELMPPGELRFLPSTPPPAKWANARRNVPRHRLGSKPRVVKLCPDCTHRALQMLVRT